MSPQLQQMIDAVCTLSPREKIELIEAISRDLEQSHGFAEENGAFWSRRSIDEVARGQAASVITDVRTLAADFWPEDESADDFNQFVAERRHADRMRNA
jgi:hypothetical protein